MDTFTTNPNQGPVSGFDTPHSGGANKQKVVLGTLIAVALIVLGCLAYFIYLSPGMGNISNQEVPISEEYIGQVTEDLSNRRPNISDQDKEVIIKALDNKVQNTVTSEDRQAIINSLSK